MHVIQPDAIMKNTMDVTNCAPLANIMIKHQEALFVSLLNALMFLYSMSGKRLKAANGLRRHVWVIMNAPHILIKKRLRLNGITLQQT